MLSHPRGAGTGETGLKRPRGGTSSSDRSRQQQSFSGKGQGQSAGALQALPVGRPGGTQCPYPRGAVILLKGHQNVPGDVDFLGSIDLLGTDLPARGRALPRELGALPGGDTPEEPSTSPWDVPHSPPCPGHSPS